MHLQQPVTHLAEDQIEIVAIYFKSWEPVFCLLLAAVSQGKAQGPPGLCSCACLIIISPQHRAGPAPEMSSPGRSEMNCPSLSVLGASLPERNHFSSFPSSS